MNKKTLSLLGIPWDKKSSFMRGPALAPPMIREAFECDSAEKYTESLFNLGAEGVIYDAGDLTLTGEADPLDKIESRAAELLEREAPLLCIGGDHAITYPVFIAFAKKYEDLNILHFDAHTDLYDELKEDRLSHGCPFARIMEAGLAKRLVQVGIRGMNRHQAEQAEKFGVEVHEMINWTKPPELIFDGPLYISFDMDALDPAFAPGVSHWEPGGLSVREALAVIQKVKADQFVGADLVEYNPKRDPHGITAMVAAKIMKELAGKLLSH